MKYFFTIILIIAMNSMYPLFPLPDMSAKAGNDNIYDQYEQRCQHLFHYADTSEMQHYLIAAAKLHRNSDVKSGVETIEYLLEDPSATHRGVFVFYELMAAYLYGQKNLPAELREKIWRSFKERPLYRGDTENHWVMYYTGLYLAAQTWKGYSGDHWYTGKSSEENFKEAEGWLNHWIKTTTTIGQGEFDSPTYHMVFLSPMLVLYQFAENPQMKKKAKMMIHYLLADFAVEHLKGMYCGAHSRDYPDDAVTPKNAPMTAWAWVFFGKTDPVMRPEILTAALSDYQMPEIIYHIATDRSEPYVHKETKRVRNVIRYGDKRNPPVYKYTYMSSDFCLGSMQGGILQPIQEHTWDVTFVDDHPHTTLFTLHPYVSGHELGMFFPEEKKFTVDEVARAHSYYGKEDKWSSSSPYERTFQHRNTIIVLYNIPKGTKFEHIDGFFPKALDARIYQPFNQNSPLQSRWIFCRAGETYIAYFPIKPYQWIEEEFNWRLRSTELKNGCIVEVVSGKHDSSFERFQQKIRSNPIRLKNFDKNLTVEYTNLEGDQLQFTYGGDRLVNNQVVDFSDYGLFSGPFLNAEVGSGELHMQWEEMRLHLDFNKLTIKEE